MTDADPRRQQGDIVPAASYGSELVFQGTRFKDEDEARCYAERLARAKARKDGAERRIVQSSSER